jgi:hypothetical protein
VPNLLALRKRRILETEAADDDENTPNSQPSEATNEKTSSRGKRARASAEDI